MENEPRDPSRTNCATPVRNAQQETLQKVPNSCVLGEGIHQEIHTWLSAVENRPAPQSSPRLTRPKVLHARSTTKETHFRGLSGTQLHSRRRQTNASMLSLTARTAQFLHVTNMGRSKTHQETHLSSETPRARCSPWPSALRLMTARSHAVCGGRWVRWRMIE